MTGTIESSTAVAALRTGFFAPTLGGPAFPAWFAIVFAVIGVVIVGVFVLIIVVIVRNARRAKTLGVDPTTLRTDMAARYLRHGLGAGGTSLTERLAELDRLRAAGSITAEEHARAREAALTGDHGGGTRPR